MLLAGLQMDPREIRKAGLRGGILSAIAFSLPFLGGFGIAALFGLGMLQWCFVFMYRQFVRLLEARLNRYLLNTLGSIRSKRLILMS